MIIIVYCRAFPHVYVGFKNDETPCNHWDFQQSQGVSLWRRKRDLNSHNIQQTSGL